jgi:hypothetical protein
MDLSKEIVKYGYFGDRIFSFSAKAE